MGDAAGTLATTVRKALLRAGYRAGYLGLGLASRLWKPITVGVRVLLIENETVVLVEHTYRRGWFLPGGGVKRDETLEGAARREVREEIGAVDIGPLSLLGVYSNFGEHKSDHVAVFVCTEFTYTGEHDEEIARMAAFPLDALPRGITRGAANRIAEYQAGTSGLVGRW